MDSWNLEAVDSFLKGNDLPEDVRKRFKDEEIDGRALGLLTLEDLTDLLLEKGLAERLLRAIKKNMSKDNLSDVEFEREKKLQSYDEPDKIQENMDKPHPENKLKTLLCRGQDNAGRVIVLSKPPPKGKNDCAEFLRSLKWHVVIDFDEDCRIRNQVYKDTKPRDVVYFAEDLEDVTMRSFFWDQQAWILANGSWTKRTKALLYEDWFESDRNRGLSNVVEAIRLHFPSQDTKVIFILSSESCELELDVFREFLKQYQGLKPLVYVAESESVAKTWEDKLREIESKERLISSRVVGICWSNFSEQMKQPTDRKEAVNEVDMLRWKLRGLRSKFDWEIDRHSPSMWTRETGMEMHWDLQRGQTAKRLSLIQERRGNLEELLEHKGPGDSYRTMERTSGYFPQTMKREVVELKEELLQLEKDVVYRYRRGQSPATLWEVVEFKDELLRLERDVERQSPVMLWEVVELKDELLRLEKDVDDCYRRRQSPSMVGKMEREELKMKEKLWNDLRVELDFEKHLLEGLESDLEDMLTIRPKTKLSEEKEELLKQKATEAEDLVTSKQLSTQFGERLSQLQKRRERLDEFLRLQSARHMELGVGYRKLMRSLVPFPHQPTMKREVAKLKEKLLQLERDVDSQSSGRQSLAMKKALGKERDKLLSLEPVLKWIHRDPMALFAEASDEEWMSNRHPKTEMAKKKKKLLQQKAEPKDLLTKQGRRKHLTRGGEIEIASLTPAPADQEEIRSGQL